MLHPLWQNRKRGWKEATKTKTVNVTRQKEQQKTAKTQRTDVGY
jgi:hypothetical protein